jgi:hypothetical protein
VNWTFLYQNLEEQARLAEPKYLNIFKGFQINFVAENVSPEMLEGIDSSNKYKENT